MKAKRNKKSRTAGRIGAGVWVGNSFRKGCRVVTLTELDATIKRYPRAPAIPALLLMRKHLLSSPSESPTKSS